MKRKTDVKAFLKKYNHAIMFLYALLYFPWFALVEKLVNAPHFHIVHLIIDDYIPFLEIFVIPYYMWFAYVAVVLGLLFLFDKETFIKSCVFLFSGMTIFLIVSTIYPNGAHLRPIVFPRNNIFTNLVKYLYSIDTPTNLFPSIHVYNSIGTHLSIVYSEKYKKYKALKIASLILCILICLSTMFIKQHSIFDVVTAIVMAVAFWRIAYKSKFSKKTVDLFCK